MQDISSCIILYTHSLHWKCNCNGRSTEQDLNPKEIIKWIRECFDQLEEENSALIPRLKAIGVTNNRETTILWNKKTGRCLGQPIVWFDNRPTEIAERMINETPKKDKDETRVSIN